MNKKELTAQVAMQTGLTSIVVLKTIDSVFETIKNGLEKGESTTLMGFGSFTVSSRKERRGINPSTKESIIIPARKVVKFSPSKTIEVK
ncbi:MAG: HU family DNA-binding protein [Rikenellaceae bacterium]